MCCAQVTMKEADTNSPVPNNNSFTSLHCLDSAIASESHEIYIDKYFYQYECDQGHDLMGFLSSGSYALTLSLATGAAAMASLF